MQCKICKSVLPDWRLRYCQQCRDGIIHGTISAPKHIRYALRHPETVAERSKQYRVQHPNWYKRTKQEHNRRHYQASRRKNLLSRKIHGKKHSNSTIRTLRRRGEKTWRCISKF